MQNDPNTEKLMNLKTYAKCMGITRQTVYNQLEKGTIEIKPIDGTKPLKWRKQEVEQYAFDKAAEKFAAVRKALADGQ